MSVVLVTIDAWRFSHASFLPDGIDCTPNLDAFATEAVAFTEAISHGPATPYAFPSIFSSTLPLDHGGYERLRTDRTLVSEALGAAGWRCTGVHSNPWLGAEGYDRGYESYRDVGEFGLPLLEQGRSFLLDHFPLDHPVYRGAQQVYRSLQEPLRAIGGDGEDEVSAARTAIRNGGARSFTWTHVLEPHAPYTPPARHRRAIGVPSVKDGDSHADLVTRAQRAPGSLSASERDVIRGLYTASVRHADERVGNVLDATPDEALVIVTADHGEALFEHGQVGHEPALFDELIRVPLLIRPPGGTDREVVDTQVRHLDLAPTVLDYASVDPSESFQGTSLRPAIEGGSIDERVAISEVASTPAVPGRIDPAALQVSARLPDRKLVYADGQVRGFDLTVDPGETDPIFDPDGPAWDPLSDALDDRRERIAFDGPVAGDRDGITEQRLRALGYVE